MAEDKTIVTKKTRARKAAPKEAPARSAPTPTTTTSTRQSSTHAKGAAPDSSAGMVSRKTTARAASTSAPAARATRKKTATAASAPASAPAKGQLGQLVDITPEQRLAMIQEAAYYKAEKRNFEAGHEQSDWIEAEQDIDELIARARAIHRGKAR